MNLKKPISAAMAAVMTLSVTATPALAAAENPPGTATQADETEAVATLGEQSSAEEDALNSSDTSEKSHQDAKVYASANGSYILTVPESINLHNVEKKDLGSGLYTNDKNCKVNLRGDVRQDQVVVVTVTEPVMQSEGSKDVDATVDTSSKTVWNRDDLFTGATAGEDGAYSEPSGVTTIYPVSAELTPGDWVGTAMFNCSLETVPSIVGAITGLEISNFDYDGNPHSPKLKFSDGTALEEGKDYTISGDTNKTEEGNYTITIKGAGKYVGTLTFNWTIKKQDISDAIIGLDATAFEENGDAHTPTIKWKEGYNLQAGVDYEVSGTTSASDVGDYKISITGKGKYKGTLDLEWTITSKPDIALAISGLSSTHFDYDGSEKAPELVFAEGYEDLVKDVDYTVSGTTSATNSGDYFITVNGIGRCKGTIKLDWNIRELIPVGGTYSVYKTKETLVGDGKTVYFPLESDIGQDTYTDDDYKYTVDSNGWSVVVTDTTKSNYGEIRSFICDKPVYGLYQTFRDCNLIKESPTIPNSITNMNYTFSNCRSLIKSPVIPNSVESMQYTFFNCRSLVTPPVIPDSVYNLTDTFNGCSSLVEAPVIPNHVTMLWGTFANCNSLKSYSGSTDSDGDFSGYVIPKNVRRMERAFYGCKSIVSMPKISNGVTNIEAAFQGCTSLVKTSTIPDSVTNMGSTFYNCTSLTEAPVIPDSVTNMAFTFMSCAAMKNYTGSMDADGDFSNYVLPDSVTDMTGTFSGCTSLVVAPIIPDNVSRMGNYQGGNNGTFYGCTSMMSYAGSKDPDGDFSNFQLPSGLEDMSYAFNGCTALSKAPAIPGSVTRMDSTFQSCTSLVEAPVISDSVMDMSNTFSSCASLKTYAGSVDPDGDFSNFVIPDSVSSMYCTFYGCESITKAPDIPNSVKNMYSTFAYCVSLLSAPSIIPDSVTNLYAAFFNCYSMATYNGSKDEDGDLSNYHLSNSVKSLGYLDSYHTNGTFGNCRAITRAPMIPDSANNIRRTFVGCTALVIAPTIPSSVSDMRNAFSGCTSLSGALTCNANPTSYDGALYKTQITSIEGSCSEETKAALLATK